MELSHRQIGMAVLAAVAIGAGWAWYNRPAPAPAATPQQGPVASTAETGAGRIYKLQDENGVWNFTDRPPADRSYTLVIETPNVTVVPSVIPEAAGASSEAASTAPPD